MSDSEKSTTNPLISVVIINLNGLDYILDCVDSVFKSNYRNFEVILIDNNSSDNSSNKCKEKFPNIRLIQNKKNFAMAARNKGIDAAQGNFMVFLDADTVVTPNWFDVLLDSYKKHGRGLYQGKLLKKDNHSLIESCGDMTNIFSTGFARGRGQKDTKQFENFQKISFPVGACTFSSTTTFQEIGYVDESSLFFLMLDDLDYGWRGWLLNIPSYYEPNCVIYHIGSPTLQWNPKKFFFMERNRLICLFSLYSKKTLIKIFPLLVIYDAGVSLFLISKGMGFTKLKSFFSFLGMLPSVLKRRKLTQSTRKLEDSEIIKNFVDYVDIPTDMKSDSSRFISIAERLNQMARKVI